jgi:hypothetical protein
LHIDANYCRRSSLHWKSQKLLVSKGEIMYKQNNDIYTCV